MLGEIIFIIIGLIFGYIICYLTTISKYKSELINIKKEVNELANVFKVSSDIEKRAIDLYDTGILYLTTLQDGKRGFQCLVEAGLLFKGAKEMLVKACNKDGK